MIDFYTYKIKEILDPQNNGFKTKEIEKEIKKIEKKKEIKKK